MTRRLSKDDYAMGLLPHIAERSHDPNTRTSCVVVGPDGEIRSTGYNGFPRGCEDDTHPERLERPEKYFWMEHAERNAVYNAARLGVSLKGCTMYGFEECRRHSLNRRRHSQEFLGIPWDR